MCVIAFKPFAINKLIQSLSPAFKCHRMPLVAQAAVAIDASSATSSLAQEAATMVQAADSRTPLACHPKMIDQVFHGPIISLENQRHFHSAPTAMRCRPCSSARKSCARSCS